MKTSKLSSTRNLFRSIATAILITGALAFTSSHAGAQILTIVNDGFEDPNLGSGFSATTFDVPGWTQAGFATLISANGSGFGVVGAFNGNSDGTTSDVGQAAGVESSGVLSQSISGFIAGTTYTLSFYLENNGAQSVDVTLGDTDYGVITPAASDSFNLVTETYTATTTGPQILSFAATVPTFDAVFLDNVSIAAVPEPSAYVLLGVGLLALVVMKRRASLI